MQVWIVFKCIGDYDDYTETVEGVFDSEEKANTLAKSKDETRQSVYDDDWLVRGPFQVS